METQKIEKAIAHYKALLTCEKFIVTGGYVLYRHGLYPATNDLDIILVNPSEEAKSILKRLQDEFPAKRKFSGEKEFLAKVKHENELVIDFFQLSKAPDHFNGTDYCSATVGHIVSAKVKSGRLKDWVQLRRIADKVCDKSKYTNAILTAQLESQDYE